MKECFSKLVNTRQSCRDFNDLPLDAELVQEIAKQAIKRQTGARGLNTVVDESTWEAYGDAYTNLGEYEEIILEKETSSFTLTNNLK